MDIGRPARPWAATFCTAAAQLCGLCRVGDDGAGGKRCRRLPHPAHPRRSGDSGRIFPPIRHRHPSFPPPSSCSDDGRPGGGSGGGRHRGQRRRHGGGGRLFPGTGDRRPAGAGERPLGAGNRRLCGRMCAGRCAGAHRPRHHLFGHRAVLWRADRRGVFPPGSGGGGWYVPAGRPAYRAGRNRHRHSDAAL